MNVKPLRNRVLIKPVSKKEKTESGILIPQTADKKKPAPGKVVAVGSGRKTSSGDTIPLEVDEGDKVLYNKFGAKEIKIQGKDLLLAKEQDILAIINE